MPDLGPYKYTGPLDCTVPVDRTTLAGKSVVITGGANGMGEQCVREFAAAGAFVTFGDVNTSRGLALEAELNTNLSSPVVKFTKCDIRSWPDQVTMFEAATSLSPSRSCDIVIANAGLSRSYGDSLFKLDDPSGPPTRPGLTIFDTNTTGSLYTFKLATHYFRRQPDSLERDRCFIMTGSMTAWIDSPGNWEYTASKYALRGLMRTARRSSHQQGIRINYVAPCYIKSAIRSAEYEAGLVAKGVEWAPQSAVAACMMKLATSRDVNGKSLMIVPERVAKTGYTDVNMDDIVDDEYFMRTQETQLRIITDEWR
jgi:NAD(P)-dependent dehydrogenase (short-subunit alcohol dehydrogenase family)